MDFDSNKLIRNVYDVLLGKNVSEAYKKIVLYTKIVEDEQCINHSDVVQGKVGPILIQIIGV